MTTYYVDLSASVNGSGSEGSPYYDFSAFSSSITAGDRIRIKRGSSKVLDATARLNVTITGSGGLTTLIDTYGTGANPILYGHGTDYNPVYIKRHEGGGRLVIQDIDVALGRNHNVRIESQSGVTISNVLLKRIRSYNNNVENVQGSDAISLGCANNGGEISRIDIEDCELFDNNGHGLKVRDNTRAIRIRRCRAWNNGLTSASHGMGTSHTRIQITSAGAWSATSGGAYQCTVTPTLKTTITQWLAVWCNNQNSRFWLTPTASSPPSAGEFYTGGSNTLEINVGAAPTSAIVRAAYLPVEAEFYDCESWDTNDYDGLEGFGFGIDDLTERALLVGCLSHDNEGAGMSMNTSQSVTVDGCVFYRNDRQGIYTPGAKTVVIRNCTAADNTQQGYRTNTGSAGTTIRNSIFDGNTGYGISSSSTNYPIDEDYNVIYGNVGGAKENVSTAGANTITTDPELDANYKIADGSTAQETATFIAGARDSARRKLRRTPDIGAHQYYARRTAVAVKRYGT